jgi:hypothetical protein
LPARLVDANHRVELYRRFLYSPRP